MTCPTSQPEIGGDATKILVPVVGFSALREHVSAMQLVSVTKREGWRVWGRSLLPRRPESLDCHPWSSLPFPAGAQAGVGSLCSILWMPLSLCLSHDQIWSCQRLSEAGLVSSVTLVYSTIYTCVYSTSSLTLVPPLTGQVTLNFPEPPFLHLPNDDEKAMPS